MSGRDQVHGGSRPSLLHSATTKLQEARLAEIFATVLDSCHELAAVLFTEVGLSVARTGMQAWLTASPRSLLNVQLTRKQGGWRRC